jgi:23S rRNA pseudouridine1911/1915/1917 synthase
MKPPLPILFEDNHLLVINKPSGLITQGAMGGTTSVHSLISDFLKVRDKKPGSAYLGIVSRLDAATSGVLVLAKTSKAASRLSEQLREHRLEKDYVAVIEGRLPFSEDWLEWTDWLVKDDRQQRMLVVSENCKGAQRATLFIRSSIQFDDGRELVQIRLHSGRKHQIRVQAASRGTPVVGDKKYGHGRRRDTQGLALHAHRLRLVHPTRKEWFTFTAPIAEDSGMAFAARMINQLKE